jgi:hypothetical protein
VKPTISASIGNWLKVAWRRLEVREIHAGDMAEQDQPDLRMPDEARIGNRRRRQPALRAEEIPAEAEGVRDQAHDLRPLGGDQRVVMRDVVDQRDRNQRVREVQRQLAQRPLAAGQAFRQPQEQQVNPQVHEG